MEVWCQGPVASQVGKAAVDQDFPQKAEKIWKARHSGHGPMGLILSDSLVKTCLCAKRESGAQRGPFECIGTFGSMLRWELKITNYNLD